MVEVVAKKMARCLLCLLLACCLIAATVATRPARVCIVGAGIGGASTAYFLRELLPPGAEIAVFEQEARVGGRIRAVQLGAAIVEQGAAVAHKENRYLTSFRCVL
jgi:predicted NAD/FAD-binding protein